MVERGLSKVAETYGLYSQRRWTQLHWWAGWVVGGGMVGGVGQVRRVSDSSQPTTPHSTPLHSTQPSALLHHRDGQTPPPSSPLLLGICRLLCALCPLLHCPCPPSLSGVLCPLP